MHRLAAFAVTALALISAGSCALPCNSQLRLNPAFASRFTHCSCSYGEWSEWTFLSRTAVPTTQCPSGYVVTEQREQRAISGTCANKVETETRCEPDLVDQIIIALGLGSSGQVITPGGLAGVPGGPTRVGGGNIQPVSRIISGQQCDDTKKVCQHVTVPPRWGKRSAEEVRVPARRARGTPEPEALPFKPTAFNMTEHRGRYKRTTQCGPYSEQYILFVIDTSGSVGVDDFNKVTKVLSELVLFFCHPIHIAVMTFDHEYFVEFCFDCFDNTCGGRVNAKDAIKDLQYSYGRTGTRYTHTAGAAQCVCDFMLTQTCGLPVASDCIDVVFITDGRSNDPNLDVCKEVACLHNRYGVTTYAMGISNAYPPELKCIQNADPNKFHLFNFLDFEDFVDTFAILVNKLLSGEVSSTGDYYVCIGTSGVGTNGCQKR